MRALERLFSKPVLAVFKGLPFGSVGIRLSFSKL